ncbi:MAG: hypothetical protein FWC67_04020 [Defluviitaleaceae bacterium]|nr:hypothetical protein [Defluviitaleaceae bacterium]
MALGKIDFEHFLANVDPEHYDFVINLHEMLLNHSKAAFDEKKTGYLGSYKYNKTKKALINLLIEHGVLGVRIYGENLETSDLQELTEDMTAQLIKAPVCQQLVHGKCSPKCRGYEFNIGEDFFQKCRYGCYKFTVTNENAAHIKELIEQEIQRRDAI